MLARSAALVYFCRMETRVKVIYDDGCPTCTVGMHLAEGIDHTKSLDFIGMNTEEGRRIISEHKLDMRRSAYVIDGENISGRADMMRKILSHGSIIGFLLSLPFRIPYLSNALYDLLARHRAHVTKSQL